TFNNLPAAGKSMTVAEVLANLPPGWDLGSVAVSGDDNASVNGSTATLDVDPGEAITVTFTDAKRGHIIVNKVAVGGNDTFSSDASGGPDPAYADFTLSGGQTPNDQELKPGLYSLSELALGGWDLTGVSISDPSGGSSRAGNTVTLDLAPGETI